jgi:formate hydrogenlyase subunit 3/multisubunit Na+/H+ antiporter MnhD subunit
LYTIFGLYFLNYPLNLIKLPEAVSSIDPWIIFVGGILIILGGINYLRAGRRYYY